MGMLQMVTSPQNLTVGSHQALETLEIPLWLVGYVAKRQREPQVGNEESVGFGNEESVGSWSNML